MNKQRKGGEALAHGSERRRWVLVATEVRQRPRDIAEERHRGVGVDVTQQRFKTSAAQHVITKIRSIACYTDNSLRTIACYTDTTHYAHCKIFTQTLCTKATLVISLSSRFSKCGQLQHH